MLFRFPVLCEMPFICFLAINDITNVQSARFFKLFYIVVLFYNSGRLYKWVNKLTHLYMCERAKQRNYQLLWQWWFHLVALDEQKQNWMLRKLLICYVVAAWHKCIYTQLKKWANLGWMEETEREREREPKRKSDYIKKRKKPGKLNATRELLIQCITL